MAKQSQPTHEEPAPQLRRGVAPAQYAFYHRLIAKSKESDTPITWADLVELGLCQPTQREASGRKEEEEKIVRAVKKLRRKERHSTREELSEEEKWFLGGEEE